MASYWIYGNAFHLNHGESFHFISLIHNTSAYVIVGFILFPGMFYFITRFKSEDAKVVKLTVLLFVLVYLFYDYNAIPYSGYVKGSLVLSRFFLPLLPLVVIALGYFINKYDILYNKLALITGTICVVSIIIFSQSYFHRLNNRHCQISKTIYNQYQDDIIIYDQSGNSSIYRYINPYFGKLKYGSNLMNIPDSTFLWDKLNTIRKDAYFIISERYDSPEKIERNKYVMDKIYSLVEISKLQEIPFLAPIDGTTVKVFKIIQN